MPKIKVNTVKIQSYASTVQQTLRRVRSIGNDYVRIGNRLDWDIRAEQDIQRRISRIDRELDAECAGLSKMNTFLQSAKQRYDDLERNNESKIPKATTTKNTNVVTPTVSVAATEKRTAEPLIGRPTTVISVIDGLRPIVGNTSSLGDGGGSFGGENAAVDAALIDAVSDATGVSSKDIMKGVSDGLFDLSAIASWINISCGVGNGVFSGGAQAFDLFLKSSVSVTKNLDTGKIIVSGFQRDGLLNGLVKWLNGGAGLGTKYNADTFADTQIGKIFSADAKFDAFAGKVGKVAKVVGNIADGIEAVTYGVGDVTDAYGKIKDIWADDTLSQKEKVCDTTAVAITSTAGLALDVAAPFVGGVVAGAVSTVPVVGPLLGIAANMVVTEGMHMAADIVTAEQVVDAVSDGVSDVSDATARLANSDGLAEAVDNTLNLVGTAAKAGVNVVGAVAKETVSAVADKATDVAETVAKFIPSEAVGDAYVAGVSAIGDAAKKLVNSGSVGEAVENTLNLVGTTVAAKVEVATTVVKETVNAVSNAAKAVGNWFKKW